MSIVTFVNATRVDAHGLTPNARLSFSAGAILAEGEFSNATIIDLEGAYLAPGFIDLHVHGGAGADFMDLTEEAFITIARCHARHGTTALTPTSTVGTVVEYSEFVELNRKLTSQHRCSARFLGGHLYGPYFREEAKGCHPQGEYLDGTTLELCETWIHSGGLRTLTIAPEVPGVERLARAASAAGLLVTMGHSYATYAEVEAAINWGARHVDHLFCAMSDRARLRLTQPFPMRAGLMEATLAHEELTTEIIADGVHLQDDLIRFAYRIKGADRLALVTDSMRALDCPDGLYHFGSVKHGEQIQKLGHAGLTADGKSLASSVVGMDHCVRFLVQNANIPLVDAIRMASLTPARILGLKQHGLQVGCWADFVVLGQDLQVQQTWVAGEKVYDASAAKAAASPSR